MGSIPFVDRQQLVLWRSSRSRICSHMQLFMVLVLLCWGHVCECTTHGMMLNSSMRETFDVCQELFWMCISGLPCIRLDLNLAAICIWFWFHCPAKSKSFDTFDHVPQQPSTFLKWLAWTDSDAKKSPLHKNVWEMSILRSGIFMGFGSPFCDCDWDPQLLDDVVGGDRAAQPSATTKMRWTSKKREAELQHRAALIMTHCHVAQLAAHHAGVHTASHGASCCLRAAHLRPASDEKHDIIIFVVGKTTLREANLSWFPPPPPPLINLSCF